MGLIFIGPSGNVMHALGDKMGVKRLAEKAGVPVARGAAARSAAQRRPTTPRPSATP
jgi:biotin carboxylase